TPPVNETLKYWVFGVEMPRVVINEVFAEYNYQGGVTMTPPAIPVHVWAELFCPMPGGPATGTTYDSTDNLNVPLAVGPGFLGAAAQPVYAPYRVMLTDTQTAPGGPLLPRPSSLVAPVPTAPFLNDNVLGTPDQTRHYYGTDD